MACAAALYAGGCGERMPCAHDLGGGWYAMRHVEVLKGMRHVLKVLVLEVIFCVLLCMRDCFQITILLCALRWKMIVTLSTAR